MHADSKRELVFSQDAWESIVRSLKARGRTPPSQLDKKQAYIVNGGFFIPNSIGTAPGQGIVVDDKLIIILPGPPHEMQPMLKSGPSSHKGKVSQSGYYQ